MPTVRQESEYELIHVSNKAGYTVVQVMFWWAGAGIFSFLFCLILFSTRQLDNNPDYTPFFDYIIRSGAYNHQI